MNRQERNFVLKAMTAVDRLVPRAFDADDQVAEIFPPALRVNFKIRGKGKDVGYLVDVAEPAVQLTDFVGFNEGKGPERQRLSGFVKIPEKIFRQRADFRGVDRERFGLGSVLKFQFSFRRRRIGASPFLMWLTLGRPLPRVRRF